MGLGKAGLYLTLITGTALAVIYYLDKYHDFEVPYIMFVAPILGVLFIIGLLVGHYGGVSHLRKHGYKRS